MAGNWSEKAAVKTFVRDFKCPTYVFYLKRSFFHTDQPLYAPLGYMNVSSHKRASSGFTAVHEASAGLTGLLWLRIDTHTHTVLSFWGQSLT